MNKSHNDLCDTISLVLFCFADNSILSVTDDNELWIPSVKIPTGSSVQSHLVKEIKEIMGVDLPTEKMLRIYKVWIPNHPVGHIFHTVFEVRCSIDQKRKTKITSTKYRNKAKWVTENELVLQQTKDSLRSPEILEFVSLAKNKTVSNPSYDCFACGNLFETNESIIVSYNSHMYDQIIIAAQFNLELQQHLLKVFLQLCFPALMMSKQTFSKFMLELGWPKDDLTQLFRTADIRNVYAVNFREFMYILAAIEPTTTHGGLAAEIRCRYIFRFFDQDNDGHLNHNEFKTMVTYMRRSKGQPLDMTNVNHDVENYYKGLGFAAEGKPLTIGEFLHAVGDLKLRGTSTILRSTASVKPAVEKYVMNDHKARNSVEGSGRLKLDLPWSRGMGLPAKSPYDIAIHTVRLLKNNNAVEVDPIWNIETAVSFSTLKQAANLERKKKTSIETFSGKSLPNEVIRIIKGLLLVNKGDAEASYNWAGADPNVFAQHILVICRQVKDLLKNEPRMVELSSPVYIMGDFHGNFPDMLNFERLFWPLGPNLCPCHLLFLGDYVDRGYYGLEVILYLFCCKAQVPEKVTLIRGNHEIREIQKSFTFHLECLNKFGEKTGLEVWNNINNVFDNMPLAATIDGKIFCCHGGIPPPWLCPILSTINQIPVPLPSPAEQSSLAWELMWNDPVRTRQITDTLAMELMANEGFANNHRRGTAHVFSVDALERFLSSNDFSHLIRAHEMEQAGFNLRQKGKSITIFSSSKYCGGSNDAACIIADQGKIRVLRIESV